MDVQTELYLEELTDAPQETEAEAQTDAFLDRPATPLYVPLKVGADVATQIEPGELFNFDVEVEPLLEVLVGKTMEQALQEVCEEEVSRLRHSAQRGRWKEPSDLLLANASAVFGPLPVPCSPRTRV